MNKVGLAHIGKVNRLYLLVLWAITLTACSRTSDRTDDSIGHWTCGMHPSIQAKAPGKCPICGMDLVPVRKPTSSLADYKNTGETSESEFLIPIAQQQRIGVAYTKVQLKRISFEVRAVGTLETDASGIFECVARVDGYVEGLRVTSPGEKVIVGQPLIDIYSPDLRAPQQDLINLLKAQESGSAPSGSMDQLISLARRRLHFLDMAESDISELERAGQPTDRLLLRSPSTGIVSEAPMRLGAGFKRGDRLMTVADLSRMWLWANFYENDIELLYEGLPVTVTVPAFPERKYEAKIGAIGPSIDPLSRVERVRIDIPNDDWLLRPGTYANVLVTIDMGQGLAVPFDSVLPTGARMLVFVDKGSGTLEPRFIQVGRQFVDPTDPSQPRYYEVKAGLLEGERVAVGGNFLIDSEAQIQGVYKDSEDRSTNEAGR